MADQTLDEIIASATASGEKVERLMEDADRRGEVVRNELDELRRDLISMSMKAQLARLQR
jgi:hypothetical protein